MGRIVAIAGGNLQSTNAINKYIVNLDKTGNNNLLFIGTASNDAEEYINNIKVSFHKLNCKVKTLSLCKETYSKNEIDELIRWANIIYIGGGDTSLMMDVWKKYEIDKKLLNVYLNDTAILTGISAGAICWFNCGHSDSSIFWKDEIVGYGWVNNLLNIHQYVFCPHYEERTESFDKMIIDKINNDKSVKGLAMESDTAFVDNNGEIKFIKCNESSKAFIINYKNGIISKKEIKVKMIR